MSEEVVTERDIFSIDPESIIELEEFKFSATEAFVAFYAKNFDIRFRKIVETLKENEEKLKKFKEIREKHLKKYEEYIEKCLNQEMRRLFSDQTIANKVIYVSDNFNKMSSEELSANTAIEPIKRQFIEELKLFEQKLDERLELKSKALIELNEKLIKSKESYESLRKSLQKRVLTIIKDLDSIDIQDLELNPKTN